MQIETMVETVASRLSGDDENALAAQGYQVDHLADLGELYLRAPDGTIFRLTAEIMTSAELADAGVDFEGG